MVSTATARAGLGTARTAGSRSIWAVSHCSAASSSAVIGSATSMIGIQGNSRSPWPSPTTSMPTATTATTAPNTPRCLTRRSRATAARSTAPRRLRRSSRRWRLLATSSSLSPMTVQQSTRSRFAARPCRSRQACCWPGQPLTRPAASGTPAPHARAARGT